MSLTTAAALDRPLITPTGPCERHLMLTLQAPAGVVRRLPLNMALVIDASGSMSGEKLARATEAACFVVRHLSTVDRVAVICYDDDVTIVAPSTLLTSGARADLLRAINHIQTGGMTNLGGGWLSGCQQVALHQHGEAQLDRALVLTDGLANVGITNLEDLVEHARQLRLRGIVTSTMGVGADFNEELLEAMARHGGGRFQYVETAKHIPDCVQGELGELLQLYARKLAVEIELPDGVRLVRCLNDYVAEETPRGVLLRLGDLIAGETRRVTLKLSAGSGALGSTLPLIARALYVATETGQGMETAFPAVALRYAEQEAVDTQQTDDEVAGEVALLLAAQAKEEAARLSRRGDHSAAAGTLRLASQTLAASPAMAAPGVAAEATALYALAVDADQGLSEAQRKEMHYQSYLSRFSRKRYDSQGKPS